MFPGVVHHLAAQMAVPARQRCGTGSVMSSGKQLLNAVTENMFPLEDASRLVTQRG